MQQWEAALQSAPAGATARRHLGQLWAMRAERLDKAGRTVDAAHAFQQALAVDEQGDDAGRLGADWFNYGQFLRRHEADPHLVLACLLQAEELLAWKGDVRLETVRAAREAVEREHPAAAAAARQSLTEALAAARVRY